MVVLEPLFWLQSMSTLPGRSDLVIRDVTRFGRARSSSWAKLLAWSLACSAVIPETLAYSCSPLPPEVLASGSRPALASTGRSASATRQHSTIVAGGPGSRSNTSRSGRASP
jgi:hypothetical protein